MLPSTPMKEHSLRASQWSLPPWSRPVRQRPGRIGLGGRILGAEEFWERIPQGSPGKIAAGASSTSLAHKSQLEMDINGAFCSTSLVNRRVIPGSDRSQNNQRFRWPLMFPRLQMVDKANWSGLCERLVLWWKLCPMIVGVHWNFTWCFMLLLNNLFKGWLVNLW